MTRIGEDSRRGPIQRRRHDERSPRLVLSQLLIQSGDAAFDRRALCRGPHSRRGDLRAQGLALASHGDLTSLESLEPTLLFEEVLPLRFGLLGRPE